MIAGDTDPMPPRPRNPNHNTWAELLQTPFTAGVWTGWALEALFDRMEER